MGHMTENEKSAHDAEYAIGTVKNARMMEFLGYAFEEAAYEVECGWHSGWNHPDGRKWWHSFPIDFTQWERFPEMQELARGLPIMDRMGVHSGIQQRTGHGTAVFWIDITPTILRDALIEVLA